MKEGYLPKEERKKILLICDDIRVHSGVATVTRELVLHTAHRYNWVNIAGAIQHPEKGKRLDLSESTNKTVGIEDSSVVSYPVDGYGSPELIRQLLKIEKPDAVFLVTDPRYFVWLFQIENEIRKQVPIVYLNIWDDYPAPAYNSAFYESCDALFGISKQTVNINKLVLGEKGEAKIIEYVPHGLNHEIFKPLNESSPEWEEYTQFKKSVFNGKEFDFVLYFNSRNIRRKQIPDTMLAWKYFIDQLPPEQAEKCAFILHTQPVDDHGTDLTAVMDYFFGDYPNKGNIFFSNSKLDSHQMNFLNNLSDAQILLTSNEGWGLALTEALLAGRPIIANVTGGMQDQMRFEDEDGNWFTPDAEIPSNNTGRYKKHGEWAFPVYPTNRSLQGSPPTPYIWDDRCRAEDAAEQIMAVYSLPKEERLARGLKGREWALSDEAGLTGEKMGKRAIKYLDQLFSTWTPREKFEFINANEYKSKTLNHKLLY
jgi:glycosyltransferase involved in cell wall biosynthesis